MIKCSVTFSIFSSFIYQAYVPVLSVSLSYQINILDMKTDETSSKIDSDDPVQ